MARRTNYYKVTHNEKYNNFMISPKLLFEEYLNFVYKDSSNKEVSKISSTKEIGPHLKYKKLFSRDADNSILEFKGISYTIPSDFVFNY